MDNRNLQFSVINTKLISSRAEKGGTRVCSIVVATFSLVDDHPRVHRHHFPANPRQVAKQGNSKLSIITMQKSLRRFARGQLIEKSSH